MVKKTKNITNTTKRKAEQPIVAFLATRYSGTQKHARNNAEITIKAKKMKPTGTFEGVSSDRENWSIVTNINAQTTGSKNDTELRKNQFFDLNGSLNLTAPTYAKISPAMIQKTMKYQNTVKLIAPVLHTFSSYPEKANYKKHPHFSRIRKKQIAVYSSKRIHKRHFRV